nr:MAG TPA_asm: hypothetical protein [Bacteriophage sp.]
MGDCGSNLKSIYGLIKFCSIFPFRLLTVILSLSEVITKKEKLAYISIS